MQKEGQNVGPEPVPWQALDASVKAEQLAPMTGQPGCEGDGEGEAAVGDADGEAVCDAVSEGDDEREKEAGDPHVHPKAAKAGGSVVSQRDAWVRAPRQSASAAVMSLTHCGSPLGGNHSGHTSPCVADSTSACVSRSAHCNAAQRPAPVEPRAQGTPDGPRAEATHAAVAT